jgi:RNA polymerase sigma-32 factor
MAKRIQDPTFAAYMAEINTYPLMTREEEYKVAKDYQLTKNPVSGQKLVKANLRFAVKVAYKYAPSGHDMMDLVQEANMGLMRGLKKFDPDKGYKFITYAVWWIDARLRNYLITNQSQVKFGTTGPQRNLFFRLRGEKAKMMALYNEISYEDLAEILGESIEDVREADMRMAQKDFSLQAPRGEEGDTTFQDVLVSTDPDQYELVERQSRKDRMDEIVGKLSLNGKEWAILERRLKSLDPLTLQELGTEFGVSRERIRQIEAQLKNRIRKEIGKQQELHGRDPDSSPDTII